MRPPPRRRAASRGSSPGFTLAEVLVALLLTFLVAALVLSTLARQRVVQDGLSRRADVLASVRVTRTVLGREIRGQPSTGEATAAWSADTLAIRAYRGFALVCPAPAPGAGAGRRLRVRPRGTREVVEGEDSVLVVFADGGSLVRRVEARWPGGCAAPESGVGWEEWELDAGVPAGALLVRYFQRVSYHLGDGTLRLRSGEGGRQPLTPEVLHPGGSGFDAGQGEAGLEAVLVPRHGGLAWRIPLAGAGGGV